MKIKNLTRFATVLLALTLALPILAQNSALIITGGDEQHLRELLGFLIWSEPGAETKVNIGSLPEDLEFALPVPPKGHVVGSITRGSNYAKDIWILSDGKAQDDLDFYSEALLAANWTAPEDMRGSSGGGFAAQTSIGAGFCAPDNKSFMWVNMEEREMANHISIHVETQHVPPSCTMGSPEMGFDPYRVMPHLETPDGVSIRDGVNGGGGGGGGGPYGLQSASTSIVLKTGFNATELRALYDAQLENQDWQLVQSGGEEASAWSTWSFTDEDANSWIGTMTITALPNKDGEYYATLYIENIPQ